MPLRIFDALAACYPELDEIEKLDIHLVGATERELAAMFMFEKIMHLLPGLKEISMFLIGLCMAVDMPEGTVQSNIPLDCCPDCTS